MAAWKWRNDRRSERNLCNYVKKPEKNSGLQRGLNPWPRDLPVRCSTNWAMKPLTLGAGQLCFHIFPWKKWVLMIYEINHIWTAEMKWKWRNCINCVHCDDHFFIFIIFLVTEPQSKKVVTIFKVLLENCIRMISCMWKSLHKQQQILLHCGINLKVLLHRMKPMEKFAFKSP